MPFRLVLFGLESTAKNSSGIDKEKAHTQKKMVSKKSSKKKRKLTPQQKKFSKAQTKCHKETKSPSAFGNCMSRELKSKKRGKK